jgi:hypothetical protein
MYSQFEPENTSQDARLMLDSYLRRACAIPEAPAVTAEQEELRQEMSGHILALAAAHEELGDTPEEAMRAALKQFGEAEQIGKAVAHEYKTRPSFLESPRTLCMLSSMFINFGALIGASYLLASTEINVTGTGGQLTAVALGCIMGATAWNRRSSIRHAALSNARLWAGGATLLLTAFCLFSCATSISARHALTSWEWWKLGGPLLLRWISVAGLSGACSGALTGALARFMRVSPAWNDTAGTGGGSGASRV